MSDTFAKVTLTLKLTEDDTWFNEFMEDSGIEPEEEDDEGKSWDDSAIHDAISSALMDSPSDFLKEFDDVAPFTIEIFHE